MAPYVILYPNLAKPYVENIIPYYPQQPIPSSIASTTLLPISSTETISLTMLTPLKPIFPSIEYLLTSTPVIETTTREEEEDFLSFPIISENTILPSILPTTDSYILNVPNSKCNNKKFQKNFDFDQEKIVLFN